MGVSLVAPVMLVALALPTAAFAGGKANVVPKSADAVLYELTENMTVEGNIRKATASLQGWAKVGTPLCPQLLIDTLRAQALVDKVKVCHVTAFGSDAINLATGSGTLWGTFSVVLNLDNALDAAEYVVMTGRFEGSMQLLGPDVPIIQLPRGTFVIENVLGYPAHYFGLGSAQFTGVFRLPYGPQRWSGDDDDDDEGSSTQGYYLSDRGKREKPKKHELSLGAATVRVEVNFLP